MQGNDKTLLVYYTFSILEYKGIIVAWPLPVRRQAATTIHRQAFFTHLCKCLIGLDVKRFSYHLHCGQSSSSVARSPSGWPSSIAFRTRRMIFPLLVFGRLSLNSISRGNAWAARLFFTDSEISLFSSSVPS